MNKYKGPKGPPPYNGGGVGTYYGQYALATGPPSSGGSGWFGVRLASSSVMRSRSLANASEIRERMAAKSPPPLHGGAECPQV